MTRAVLLSLGVILSVSSPAFADQTCKPVVGHFEALVQPPQQCPAILCTAGRVWGGLQGTYQFTMTTLVNSGAVPSVQFFTGDSEVTTKSGDLVNGIDTGSIDLGPNGGFASLITFNGGSGAYANATGQIRLRGQLDMAEGTTTGDYIGTICTP
jgi:hypothetical protein